MKCPICESKFERKKVNFTLNDITLGKFDADVCTECGEKFFTEEDSDEIDKIAKTL